MDPHQSPPDSEPPLKNDNGTALGFGLSVLLHLLQLPLWIFDHPLIMFFGITQLFYIVPTIAFFNKREREDIVRGLIIGAAITFVLGLPFVGLALICGSKN